MAIQFTIRQAVPQDENAVRVCAEGAYTQYIAAIGKKPAPMIADFGSQISHGHVHVAAAEGGEVVGFIVFYMSGGDMHLENVAVSPSASGMGIGKSLITFCEGAARRSGAASVQLYTNEKMTGNLSIYPHLGYRETDRRTENGFNRVFFEKTLR